MHLIVASVCPLHIHGTDVAHPATPSPPEAIEAECKRVGELLQTERSAHRETSLLLKEMAIQHMDEQRQKVRHPHALVHAI